MRTSPEVNHSLSMDMELVAEAIRDLRARAEVRRWPEGSESKMTGAGRGGKKVPLGYQEPISCDA
jgi:hypothetical protein